MATSPVGTVVAASFTGRKGLYAQKVWFLGARSLRDGNPYQSYFVGALHLKEAREARRPCRASLAQGGAAKNDRGEAVNPQDEGCTCW